MGREPVDDGGGRNRRYGRLLDMPGPSPIPPELITGPFLARDAAQLGSDRPPGPRSGGDRAATLL